MMDGNHLLTLPLYLLWCLHKFLAGLTFILLQHNAQHPIIHHLNYLTHHHHFAHDPFLIGHPLSSITNGQSFGETLGPFLLVNCIQHIHSYSDLLIDLPLADNYPDELPIVLLSSYWKIAVIYLQFHSHISSYISTCTYTRDGQLLSWSILLADSESHQPLALPSSTILVSLWPLSFAALLHLR